METLKLKALIKDAGYYKIILHKSDGFIYHLDSSTMMGRNTTDLVEFLKNPLNDNILLDITKKLKSIGILNILYIDIMAKKKVTEYKGTKAEETYSSKSAMMKHEKTEGKSMEKKKKY